MISDECTAAARLRATADAIEADARERAVVLRALAAEMERVDDPWLTMADVGRLTGRKPRAARDWLVRHEIDLAPRNARVRRSVVDRLLAGEAVHRVATPANDAEEVRAALARAGSR